MSRFSEQDRGDILLLARQNLFTADELLQRSTEALKHYVGDTRWIRVNLDELENELTT